MILAVHQPQYVPWIGFFDKIQQADLFVLLDNVQFKKNEWQNRNRIKTSQGWQWLTVPIEHHFGQKIQQVKICQTREWRARHVHAILTNYHQAPYFETYWREIEDLFTIRWEYLSALNIYVIQHLMKLLDITTPVHIASQLPALPEQPDERLVALARYFGATTYLAGAGGRSYMNLKTYHDAKIDVVFQDYSHPVYPQLFGPFEPYMSVLDLLFNCGDHSRGILSSKEEMSYEYTGNWSASRRY